MDMDIDDMLAVSSQSQQQQQQQQQFQSISSFQQYPQQQRQQQQQQQHPVQHQMVPPFEPFPAPFPSSSTSVAAAAAAAAAVQLAAGRKRLERGEEEQGRATGAKRRVTPPTAGHTGTSSSTNTSTGSVIGSRSAFNANANANANTNVNVNPNPNSNTTRHHPHTSTTSTSAQRTEPRRPRAQAADMSMHASGSGLPTTAANFDAAPTPLLFMHPQSGMISELGGPFAQNPTITAASTSTATSASASASTTGLSSTRLADVSTDNWGLWAELGAIAPSDINSVGHAQAPPVHSHWSSGNSAAGTFVRPFAAGPAPAAPTRHRPRASAAARAQATQAQAAPTSTSSSVYAHMQQQQQQQHHRATTTTDWVDFDFSDVTTTTTGIDRQNRHPPTTHTLSSASSSHASVRPNNVNVAVASGSTSAAPTATGSSYTAPSPRRPFLESHPSAPAVGTSTLNVYTEFDPFRDSTQSTSGALAAVHERTAPDSASNRRAYEALNSLLASSSARGRATGRLGPAFAEYTFGAPRSQVQATSTTALSTTANSDLLAPPAQQPQPFGGAAWGPVTDRAMDRTNAMTEAVGHLTQRAPPRPHRRHHGQAGADATSPGDAAALNPHPHPYPSTLTANGPYPYPVQVQAQPAYTAPVYIAPGAGPAAPAAQPAPSPVPVLHTVLVQVPAPTAVPRTHVPVPVQVQVQVQIPAQAPTQAPVQPLPAPAMNAAIATNPGSRAELTATGQLNVAGRLHEAHVMLARSLAQARATASREQQQGQGRTAATRSAQAAVEQARLQYAQVQTAAMLMQSSGSRPAQVQAAAMALQSSASASAHAPALVPVPRYHVLLGSCRITAEMDARQSAKTLRRVLMEAAHFPPEIRGRLATPTLKVMAYADVDEEEEGMARDECCAVCQENYTPADKIAVTQCKHMYHKACLQTWVDKAATCPMCRRDLAGLGCVLKVSGPELADKVRRLWLDAPTDLPVHRDF